MDFSRISLRSMLIFVAAMMVAPVSAWAGDVGPYWRFSGVFHPAVAHFPIALLVVAAVIEGFRVLTKKGKVPGEAGYVCLVLGAAGAVATAILGWANADAGGDFNGSLKDVLFWHRWMGVGVAAGAVVAVVVATLARRGERASSAMRWASRLSIAGCAAVVGLVGSYGGKLTHGVTYYADAYDKLQAELQPQAAPVPTKLATPDMEAAPASAAATPTAPPAEKPSDHAATASTEHSPVTDAPSSTPTANPAATADAPATTGAAGAAGSDATAIALKIDFHKQIKPIFQANCFKCHDANKSKGEYRLDTKSLAFTPGESKDAPIVAGKPDDSLLVKVIEGKGKYQDDMMPPKGGPLTAEQIGLIRQWIRDGAEWPE